MTFNEKLLSLRKKAGLSQEDLAEKLDVSRQAVSRWETGETLPDAKNLLELSSIFETSIDYLLRDEMDFPSITSKPVQIPKAPPKKSPVLYEVLCSLPLLLVCIAADISLAAMIVCFLCTLLTNFSRVFTVKSVPFSHLQKSMRDRIFLAYVLSCLFLSLSAVAVYFALPASGEANRAILLTLFAQIYVIVHMETFIYFPGDKSPTLCDFRRKFYSVFSYFSVFPIAALCARALGLMGKNEATAMCIILIILTAVCASITLILKTEAVKKDAS